MFPLWQGELTPLVTYCSKTKYISAILLRGYAKHVDAQFPQQVDEIHLYQDYEANQPFTGCCLKQIVCFQQSHH